MNSIQKKNYVESWKKREKANNIEKEKLAEQAMKKAKSIANLLKNEFKVKKVILFGSLAENNFRKESDIDIAIIDYDKKEYLDMFNTAYDIASPFKIDLLPLKNASDTLKKRILTKGVEL